jgi:predicted membrane channel-forming protein YqfA (hemolysin III family)
MFLKKTPLEYVPIKPKKMNHLIFFAYLILGAYFVNFHFEFFEIPEIIADVNSWIILAGGVFMLFGALNYFNLKKR